MRINPNQFRARGRYDCPRCETLFLASSGSFLTMSDGTSEVLDPSEYDGADEWTIVNP